jgi:hypothetical protein
MTRAWLVLYAICVAAGSASSDFLSLETGGIAHHLPRLQHTDTEIGTPVPGVDEARLSTSWGGLRDGSSTAVVFGSRSTLPSVLARVARAPTLARRSATRRPAVASLGEKTGRPSATQRQRPAERSLFRERQRQGAETGRPRPPPQEGIASLARSF